jgi:hypothetical protein
MKLWSSAIASPSKRFMLLAPPFGNTSGFRHVEVSRERCASLLAGLQRLRARVYLETRGVEASQLTEDGRHVQFADNRAWHLITVTPENEVLACARYILHDIEASYSDLGVSRSALANSSNWGDKLRDAVETELTTARRRNFRYAELGGWAIAEALRCTTEAFRIMLGCYALSEWFGGVLGITTARRVCSAPLLRKVGGRPVALNGEELPPYFDPQYRCEMEVLRFDSSCPTARFEPHIHEFRSALRNVQVISPFVSSPFPVPFSMFAENRPCLATP